MTCWREMSDELLKIGLLGRGTVGAAFAELVEERADEVARSTGRRPVISGVLTRSEGDAEAIRNEAADLLFHLLVVLKASNVPLDEVMGELARRTAQSGLEEKAARPQS